MMERYSHIRSLEERAKEPILEHTGRNSGRNEVTASSAERANSQETNGGPARIRTWDRRIMSPLL
jgi:hypothetical protein